MKRVGSLPRLSLTLMFLLSAACATTRATAPGGESPRKESKPVRVDALPGGALRLSFEPLTPDLAWEQLRLEEARAVLAALHESLPPREKGRPRLVLASAGAGNTQGAAPEAWELRLREEFLSRYGPSRLPLPHSLEASRLFMTLKLSPRYMGEGVREAARELFNSPLFVSSVALSVFIYFAAWLAPEPVFTKAFVAALTLRLTLAVGALELGRVAWACLQLYQEAEAARTVQELEAAAERFGKAMGGTGLRVLMLVASMGVAKGLPEVPTGGLGALLRAPRFSLPGGLTMGGTTTVQMVADGTVIVTGVAAGTAAAAGGSACIDGSEPKDGYYWHHLATNKNNVSTQRGGPWTPRFEILFELAGMSLEAKENLIYLKGHQGPHPEQYHQEIHRRLQSVLAECRDEKQCRSLLADELKRIADEVCTPGTELHRLLTNG
ncbi:AHH domain-containing protein [Archangium sp.]|uniref:AHH domain-containing protein n=1 Tax=Archangium sp. TaxID=1872627 RepID=UPI00389A2CA1